MIARQCSAQPYTKSKTTNQNQASNLPEEKIPEIVVSNIGCYRNVARKDEGLSVSGMLERVEKIETGEIFYQVVVGTAINEEEYIWPV